MIGCNAFAAALLPWLALGASAQDQAVPAKQLQAAPQQQKEPTQDEFVAKRDEKMKLEVFQKNPWTFDFDAARAQAKKEGKLILTYFSRSYAHWGPCTALENNVFSKPEFGEFAKQVVLFTHVTTHVKTDRYQTLLSEMGFNGFPSVAFLDAEGNMLEGHVGGEKDVAGFEKLLGKAESYAKDVAAKAQAGDAEAQKKVLLDNVARASIKLADAKKALESRKDLSKEERAKIEAKLPTLEMNVINGTAWEDRPGAAKKLASMFKAGRIPEGADGDRLLTSVVTTAETEKDVKLFEEAFAKIKQRSADNPRAQKQIEALEKKLEKLKEAAKADGKSG